MRGVAVFAALLSAAFCVRPAHADIWARQGREGVLYLTNISPAGQGWKRIYRTGPGKAGTISGASANCNRAGVVPASDRSVGRFARFNETITQAAALYQIPEALIHAVIKIESDYDPRVVSCTGAQGLMQLMPSAQKDMSVTNAWDPHQNIMGGTRLLRTLANRFSGDLMLTIAGYHAGPAAVNRYRGIPPYETTQRYVQMVLKAYESLKPRFGAARPATPPSAAPDRALASE